MPLIEMLRLIYPFRSPTRKVETHTGAARRNFREPPGAFLATVGKAFALVALVLAALLLSDEPASAQTNNAPVFASSEVTRSVEENTGAGQNVGDAVSATDADSDDLTYTLGGDDHASFEIVSNSGQIRTKSGVTYDHEAKSSYSVTVTASDGNGGTADATVTINVTDKDEPPAVPGAPTVAADVGTSTGLRVSWTAPANDGKPAISGYGLQYRKGTIGAWTAHSGSIAGSDTSATLTGLDADGVYQVQVRATNDEGTSGWSASGQGRTNAPRTVEALVSNAGQGSDTVVAVAATGTVAQRFTTGAATLDFRLDSVEVTFEGTIGEDDRGPYLAIYTVDASGFPDALHTPLEELLGDDYVAGTLAVSAPADAYLLPGTTYAVVIHNLNDNAVSLDATSSNSEDSGGATGWTIADGYESTNTSGTWSAGANNARIRVTVKGYTAGTEPRAPSFPIVAPVPRSTSSVTVNWSAPVNTGRPAITGYQMRYSNDPDFGWTDRPGNLTGGPVTLGGFDEWSWVYVQVRAVNSAGVGPWSDAGVAVTNPGVWEVDADYGLVPPGIRVGDKFRLLWVVSDPNYVHSGRKDVGQYHAAVGADLSFVVSEPLELLDVADSINVWAQPVISTTGVDAKLHSGTTFTDTDKGVPIYWLNGTKVADDYEDFYDGNWDDEANPRDSKGALITVTTQPWTGSNNDGTELLDGTASRAAGQPRVGIAGLGSSAEGAGPLSGGATAPFTEIRPLFGLTRIWVVREGMLVSNLAQGELPAEGDTDDDRSARRSQRFTTGASSAGYELTAVSVDADNDDLDSDDSKVESDSFSVAVYTVDSSGHPDTKLIQMPTYDSDWFTFGGRNDFEAPSGSTLHPNTTYAVVITPTVAGRNLDLDATTSNDENERSLSGFSIADALEYESGSTWVTESSGKALKIAIRGSAIMRAPDKPTGLSAAAMGRYRIDLSWTAPAVDGGSPLTGYRIEVSPNGTTWTDLVADTESTATTYAHTGLMPNDTRHYRVSAINAEGTGDASDTAMATTHDDPAVTVSFGKSTYTVAESDDTGTSEETENEVSVTVTLSANPERSVIIPITKTNQGGASDTDYYGVPANVSFASGETSKSFTFTATHDTDDDDGESVKLTFGTLPARVTAGSRAETTISITDDDDPAVTVSFGKSTYTVAESDDTGTSEETENEVTVTVTLSANPERSVIIPITKTNQGGASSSDYSGVPASVSFASGETSKSFTFTATHDTDDDDGESVKLTFGTLPARVTAGSRAETTISITDDDDPAVTVSFGMSTYTVAESDDPGTSEETENEVSVTVTLSANPERSVAIPITKTNQGGASSSDYSGVPTSVAFASGETSKSFTFKAEHDTTDDDGESVKLAFGNLPAGVTAGATATTTISITDDDAPSSVTVKFGFASYSAIEGQGVDITVALSDDPERTVVIPLSTAHTGGASSSDYSGVPASVTFNAGETSKSFTLSAVQDNLVETRERVTISFGMLPSPATAGTPNQTIVSLSDTTQQQTEPPTVHFGAASYTVTEGGTVDVTVTLSKAPGSDAVIPITATNQGGAASADYSGVPASVTFASAETSKTITFSATDDTVDDDEESVKLSFGTLPGGITATTGRASETTISITDNDDPAVTVSFGKSTYTVAESDDTGTSEETENEVTVTVTLSANPERSVIIPITKTNQGGASSADYSGVPASVSFASGETSKSFTFTATHDTADDDGESVKLAFGNLPAGVTAGATATTTISITDDDDPAVTVSFGMSTYTVAESDDTGTSEETENEVSVTVTLSANPERSVTIPITKTNQGGASSSDYSGVPANVSFASGETSKSFTFTATHDTADDDGESVKLAFGNLPARVTAGSRAETTISITDDDDPAVTVSFGMSTYTVAESDDTGTSEETENEVTVTVTLSANPERSVTIPITKTNQGGASDTDYSGVPANVSFASGETSKSFTFTATHDTTDDDGESVKLTFGTLPARVTAGSRAETTISITDDDDPSVTVSFGSSTYTVAEGGTVDVVVTLSADPERSVTIPITKTNQGTTSDDDYSGVPASIAFSSGETSKTITFSATDDTDNDDGESVKLTFGTLPTGVSAGPTAETTVTITDDCASASLWCYENVFDLERPDYLVRGVSDDHDKREVDRFEYNNVVYEVVEYTINHGPTPLEVIRPPYITPERTKFHFGLEVVGGDCVRRTSTRSNYSNLPSCIPWKYPNDDYLDWTVEVSWVKDGEPHKIVLPVSEGRTEWLPWNWSGIDIYDLALGWTEEQVYRVSVVLDPRADRTPRVTGPPRYLSVMDVPDSDLWVKWAYPQTRNDREPPGVSYKLQWKLSTGSWETPGDVVEQTPRTGSRIYEIKGLTPGSEYEIRVIAVNSVGDSPPSNVISYTRPASSQSAAANSEATGAPTITGTAQVGETLTAGTSGISDADGMTSATFSYQWIRTDLATFADEEIPGATGSTYAVTGDDDGKGIKVRVSFTDDAGNVESLTSYTLLPALQTGDDSPANTPATGSPTISGAAQVGQTLAVSTTGIADADGLTNATFTYQWLADDAEISGATGSRYTLAAAEQGKAIKARVSFTDDAGNAESLTSAPTAAVAPPPLTASASEVPGSHDGSSTFTFELHFSQEPALSYATLRDHAFTVTGGTIQSASRLDPPSNAGWTITVEPSGDGTVTLALPVTTDCAAQGAICTGDGRMLSTELELEVPGPSASRQNNPATGAPAISGTPQVGQTLAVSTSAIADADGLTNATFTYIWLAADAEISGATGLTYTLVASDRGKAITVRVSFTDDAGNPESVTSAATAAVTIPPLTASARGAPASHDGSASFTFELHLSEDPERGFSYVTMRDHAFTVTGGAVVNARRLTPGSNLAWEITVQPSSTGDVTIVLPVTTDCTAEGAICTGDGRMLSTRLEITVAGAGG